MMKIKCIAYLDAFGQSVEFSKQLTLGKIYDVLGIHIKASGDKSYHIFFSDQEPALSALGYHSSKSFEIVTTNVPSSWSLAVHTSGALTLSPSAWQVPGFLEALYDGDESAFETFEREREKIFLEE